MAIDLSPGSAERIRRRAYIDGFIAAAKHYRSDMWHAALAFKYAQLEPWAVGENEPAIGKSWPPAFLPENIPAGLEDDTPPGLGETDAEPSG